MRLTPHERLTKALLRGQWRMVRNVWRAFARPIGIGDPDTATMRRLWAAWEVDRDRETAAFEERILYGDPKALQPMGILTAGPDPEDQG